MTTKTLTRKKKLEWNFGTTSHPFNCISLYNTRFMRFSLVCFFFHSFLFSFCVDISCSPVEYNQWSNPSCCYAVSFQYEAVLCIGWFYYWVGIECGKDVWVICYLSHCVVVLKIYGFQKYEVLLFFAMLFKTYFMRLLNKVQLFSVLDDNVVWIRERLKAKGKKKLFGKNVYAANNCFGSDRTRIMKYTFNCTVYFVPTLF